MSVIIPSVTLRNGAKMPMIGLGTWLSNHVDVRSAVESALEAGYRHIDTAYAYGNEAAIGEVLEKWTKAGRLRRDDLFVVTKLPGIGNRPESVTKFMSESLGNLKLDYVDLYLIHTPVGLKDRGDGTLGPIKEDGTADLDFETDHVKLWKAMEDQVKQGKAKAIGLSNFNVGQIRRILDNCEIPPANLQVEIHAYLQQKELRRMCEERGITVCAYGPLGSPGRFQLYTKNNVSVATIPVDLLSHKVVRGIAEKHGRTCAQILLRHLTQQGVVVIPKSVTPARIIENIQIFDFELTPTELNELDCLDKGEAGRSFQFKMPPGLEAHPEHPLKGLISS